MTTKKKPTRPPAVVPTHEAVRSVLSIPGPAFDEHDDTVGLVLAMADQSWRVMVADYGVDPRMLSVTTDAGTLDETKAPVVVVTIEGHRPFGWVKPADHVGEPGSEVS